MQCTMSSDKSARAKSHGPGTSRFTGSCVCMMVVRTALCRMGRLSAQDCMFMTRAGCSNALHPASARFREKLITMHLLWSFVPSSKFSNSPNVQDDALRIVGSNGYATANLQFDAITFQWPLSEFLQHDCGCHKEVGDSGSAATPVQQCKPYDSSILSNIRKDFLCASSTSSQGKLSGYAQGFSRPMQG